ncbi:hypothetical protein VTI74DRAFT_6049 [Chaetomium olivicolor]
MCVFIDGLDEVCEEDDAIALMRVVDSLRAIPNVKVCVASRLEPRFSRRLQSGQHLRLQDLTVDDMRKYAHDLLAPYLGTSPRVPSDANVKLRITDSVAYKAEGVFLWLHLAIRSLIRGLDNGNHNEELAQRLASLPTELEALYADMWLRLNEDRPIYCRTTALFLNMLLDVSGIGQRIVEKAPPYMCPSLCEEGDVDLFHFMVATPPAV